jgi:HEAT repeat protein
MTSTEMAWIRPLVEMLTGDPERAMESAKKLIGMVSKLDPKILATIAEDKAFKKWARIGSIYVLGLSGYPVALKVLLRVLLNKKENLHIRTHAAEALGNLQDRRAVVGLARVLTMRVPLSLKRNCVFALTEIDSPLALSALRRYVKSHPSPRLIRQLQEGVYKDHV